MLGQGYPTPHPMSRSFLSSTSPLLHTQGPGFYGFQEINTAHKPYNSSREVRGSILKSHILMFLSKTYSHTKGKKASCQFSANLPQRSFDTNSGLGGEKTKNKKHLTFSIDLPQP